MEEQIRISFFRHYTNAKQDEKIIQLLRKEQWQGYGIYWALLEFLTPIKDHKAKCEYDAIAWDLRVDEVVIKRIVENYGLFVVKNGYFWSKSLTSQLDETAENIKRKKAAASRAGKSSAEKRKAANTNSNDSSTDVAENPTSVATDDGSPLINDIHDIHEIDIRDDVSISPNEEKETSSSSSSSSDDDETRHFDNRLSDGKFIKLMRNYMYKGAADPAFEATKLIDIMEPAWQLKDGRSFKGKEEEACFCWQVDRGRKYIDSARLTVGACRGVDRFLELMTAAKVYDPKAYSLFRGCHYDEEQKVFTLFVEDAKDANWFEKNAVKQVVPIFRSIYPGVRFDYQLRKGE